MGFYEETGILILGTRLKRLSEKFLSEVAKIYEELKIDFEPAWFPIIFLLYRRGPLSITKISEELKVSQPGASQLVSLLNKKGFLTFIADKDDKRRKIVTFSPEGQKMIRQLVPVWEVLEKSMFEIFNDGESEESHVVDKFNQLEQKLNRISIGDSVLDKLKNDSEGDV
jgi:DNA-binding MarR family transcriptional regulator